MSNPLPFVCVVNTVTCPALMPPDNAAVNVTGDIAMYTCVLGYQLNGPEKRVCNTTSGVWSGNEPTCVKGI